jgi:hypothetical protein
MNLVVTNYMVPATQCYHKVFGTGRVSKMTDLDSESITNCPTVKIRLTNP